jgi:hypothetical protein
MKNVKKPWWIIQETDGRLPSGIGAWWTSAAENNKWHEFEQLRVWHRSKILKKTSSLQSRLFSYGLRDFIHILFEMSHLLFCKTHFCAPKKYTYLLLVCVCVCFFSRALQCIRSDLVVFRRVRRTSKSVYQSVMFVCPSVWNISPSTGRIFTKFYI